MPVSESELQEQVADYLRLQYPDVLFHSDFGSGVKLTPGQAMKQKRQNGGRRAWPDMFIAKMGTIWRWEESPTGVFDHLDLINLGAKLYGAHGLFLELKKEGTRLKKKVKIPNEGIMSCGNKEEWATPHIAEQAKVLEDLRHRGYCAEFAVGFDKAKRIIDEYLGGK